MKRLYICLVLCCTFFACKKFLDKKPDAKLAIPQTLDDYQALLSTDVIVDASVPGLSDLGTDDYFLRQNNYNTLNPLYKNAYTWESDIYNGSTNYLDWVKPYQNIYIANVVIEGLNNFQVDDPAQQTKKNIIYGHALFLRAFMHLSLEELYGQPYKQASANTDLGIPLKLVSSPDHVATRATVQTVFNQIIADLEQAKDWLPANFTSKNRPTKASAFALMARASLIMQDYQRAAKFADSSLAYNKVLFDYNLLSSGSLSGNNVFNTFVQPNTPNELNFETLYFSTQIPHGVIRQLYTSVDTILFNHYNSNDIRRAAFFRLQTAPNGPGYNFKGNYTGSALVHFGGLTISEVYLIRAECYARAGDKNNSLAYLDSLLIKRWKNNGTFAPSTAVDADDALKKILLERRKELLFRGVRWSDLRRLNQDPRFADTLVRFINGQEYRLYPNDKKYTYPIPDIEIQLSGIPQNPR